MPRTPDRFTRMMKKWDFFPDSPMKPMMPCEVVADLLRAEHRWMVRMVKQLYNATSGNTATYRGARIAYAAILAQLTKRRK